ncbi:hypothetical protein C8R42DRAFT_643042 [Lentinula raphanica]|nr:hypothetical protein C8R42DRAFT_643042 [Lentinula raphanica]
MVVESMDHKGGRKHNRQEQIVDLHTILSRPQSFSVKDPFKASGEHIGKLARRVTHRSPGHSLKHDEALFVLQEVHYREEQKGNRLSTVEYFDEVAEPLFELDRNALVLVHESAALKSVGNWKITALREKHGGNTNGLIIKHQFNDLLLILNERSVRRVRNDVKLFMRFSDNVTCHKDSLSDFQPLKLPTLCRSEQAKGKAKPRRKRGKKAQEEQGGSSDIEFGEVTKIGTPQADVEKDTEEHSNSEDVNAGDRPELGRGKGAKTRQGRRNVMGVKQPKGLQKPQLEDSVDQGRQKGVKTRQARGNRAGAKQKGPTKPQTEDSASRPPTATPHEDTLSDSEKKGWEIVLQFFSNDDMKLPAAEAALRNLYGESYDHTIWHDTLREINDFEGEPTDWWEIYKKLQKKLGTYIPEIDDWPLTRKVPDQSVEEMGMKTKDDDHTEGGGEEHPAEEKGQQSDSESEDRYYQWDLDHFEEAKSVDPVAARRIRDQYAESLINAAKEFAGDAWQDHMADHPKLRHVVQTSRKSAWDEMHRIAHSGWRRICDSKNSVPTSPVKPLVDYQSSLVMDPDSERAPGDSEEGSEAAAVEEEEEAKEEEEGANDDDEETDEEERQRQQQRQKQHL